MKKIVFLTIGIAIILSSWINLFCTKTGEASSATEITVDVSQRLGQMPAIVAVGVELSQWGNDFYKFYFRKKYEHDIENIGSIYRTGLNLRYHVSDLSDSIKKYVKHLSDFDSATSSYEKEGVNLILTIYGMPKWLSERCIEKGDGEYICGPNWGATPPTDYDAWAEHVKGIVSYYKHKSGLDLWYEIWNEPDQGYLFSNTDFWLGSQEEYFTLYKYSVKGALEADPHVKIGGPGGSIWDKGVIEEFIKYAATNNLPIDFITWHMYVGWNNFWGTKSEYREMANTIKQWLRQYGYDENTPLIIDEWNHDASLNDLEEHTTEWDSAYVVYAIYNMLDTGIDKQTFFNFVDFENNSLFSGSTGTMSNEGIIKSVYNALKALAILQGKSESEITHRLKADVDDSFLAAIASQTKDNRIIRILISNYIPTVPMLKNAFSPEVYPSAVKYRKNPREITLDLKNVPFSGNAIMTTYLIDYDHANSCKYNKKTEEVQTNAPCGKNGIVDKLVMQAEKESQEKAFLEAVYYLKYKGYTEIQIAIITKQLGDCFKMNRESIFKDCIRASLESTCSQVMDSGSYPPDCNIFEQDIIDCNSVYHSAHDDLFFSGAHTSLLGQTITVSTWIDKINNDPNISLEGSKQTKQIDIINGSYQESITLRPYSVFLIELTLPETSD
ncbi:MAG: hypothetical protein MRJ65_16905 [Candidatus Brocadiaceae bacterium]|nr:hypothetical protein [Candidatus Brocadiaceae bacterium]